MFDWSAFTLFLFILMRMSGFILFSPIFGRNNVSGIVKAGLVLMLSVSVYTTCGQTLNIPDSFIAFVFRLLMELFVGFVLAMIMRFFLYIPEQAGEMVDTQMGMSMNKTYDPSSHSSMTNTATLLNIMTMLLFFAANGHVTLLRLMMTSGEIIPFGQVTVHPSLPSWMVQLFAECALLAVKLAFPVLAAELMGQMGMGIIMKVIPQINVFAINIEFKVIVGLLMLLALIMPMSDFLLEAEGAMLDRLQDILPFMSG